MATPSGSCSPRPGPRQPGEVTYGEAFTVQPFGNSLVTKTMTGAQIHRLLEQQFVGCGGQPTTQADPADLGRVQLRPATPAPAPCADKVGGLTLNGAAIDPADDLPGDDEQLPRHGR